MQKNSYVPYQYPPFYTFNRMPDLNFANNNPFRYRVVPPPGGIDYLLHDLPHYSAHNLDAYNKLQTLRKDKPQYHSFS